MNNQQSSSNNFFVLGDSHAKIIPSTLPTSSYRLITRSIPGLKWIDNYDPKLSVYALLSLPEIQFSLSQAKAVLFLVGTNSVRIMQATQIIAQVQQIIRFVQQNYPHLNQPSKISISLTFPCFKTTRRFPTVPFLISNINLYNQKLILLSSQMNFNIFDLHITNDHLANDNMHIHSRFRDYIISSIINYFDQVIQTTPPTTTSTTTPPTTTPITTPPPTTSTTTPPTTTPITTPPPTTSTTTPPTTTPITTPPTTDPILSLPSTSSSVSEKEKCSKHRKRSREALNRQNKKNNQKRKMKQQQHKIIRKVHHQWTISQIKGYLDSLNIPYARIQSITNSILRILFDNQHDQDFFDTHLGIDKFTENCYNEYVNNRPS